MERLEHGAGYRLRGVGLEIALRITILYPVERDGTVPMKPWKHGGGMAISRQQTIN